MGRVAQEQLTPLGEINTTPLIDVLLVLLVMLIITIPVQTHAVKFELGAPTPVPQIIRPSNLITIKADRSIRWNGQIVNQEQLRALLSATSQMDTAPELHVRPDADAKHGDVDRLLVLIKREQVRRFGFVGNEQYRNVF
jgi:biopolymer transport protein ExbD